MGRREIVEDSTFTKKFEDLDNSIKEKVESAVVKLSLGEREGKFLRHTASVQRSIRIDYLRLTYTEDGNQVNILDIDNRDSIYG